MRGVGEGTSNRHRSSTRNKRAQKSWTSGQRSSEGVQGWSDEDGRDKKWIEVEELIGED